MAEPPDIEEALHRLYVAAPGTTLRKEDRKKTAELAGLLAEIDRIVRRAARGRALHIVDAAAGKAYVGLLVAELVLFRQARRGCVTLIERDRDRATACRQAAAALRAKGVVITVVEADVAAPASWPSAPDLVVALHACGPAADEILRQGVACHARHLLLVPCCTSKHVAATAAAACHARALGLPSHAEVRRRFVEAVVAAERTLALEAAGYQTEVIPFVPPTVTPYNLLWRARRVGEPRRMAAARQGLRRLWGSAGPPIPAGPDGVPSSER
jgi:hypothetical protein